MATETDSFSPSDPSNSGEQDEARIRVGARRNRRTVPAEFGEGLDIIN